MVYSDSQYNRQLELEIKMAGQTDSLPDMQAFCTENE